MEKLLSTVIVNFNSDEDLKILIPTLIGQSDEIIVIDNGSVDQSYEIACAFPETIVIRTQRNLGYAGGANLGISMSRGKYVAILNPDTYFTPNYFKFLVKTLENNGKIGAITGKLLRFDGKTIDTTGQFRRLSDRPRERGYGKKDKGQYKTGEVFSVCGAVALYRRSALETVKDEHGYFDERYFAFFEDFDLGWRLQRKGWKAWFEESAVGFHRRGGGKRGSFLPFLKLHPKLKAITLRNYWLTILKNETPQGFIVRFPFILLRSITILLSLLLTPSAFIYLIKELRRKA